MSQGTLALFDPLPLLTVAATEAPAPNDPIWRPSQCAIWTAERAGAWCRHYQSDAENPYKRDTPLAGAVARGRGKEEATPLPRLRTVVDVFPELLDAKLPEDNRPSCSLAEALESQDLFINQAVVTWGLQLLWKLFREGKIDCHGYFINLKDGRVNPLAIDSAKKGRKAE